MRLAFVHKHFGREGGTERVLVELARGLAARGHRIDLFCASWDRDLKLLPNLQLRPLPVWRGSAVLRNLSFYLAARLLVRASRYDLVVHFGRSGPGDVYRSGGGCHRRWLGLLSAASSPLRRLLLRFSPRQAFLLWHERRAIAGPCRIVVPSPRARQELVDCYEPGANKVEVLANGVDLGRFRPELRQQWGASQRAAWGVRPGDRVLLFVGSDYWRKGLDRVLAALARIESQGQRFVLLVAGGDRRQAAFRRRARSLAVGDQVLFLGAVAQPELLYAAADLLLILTRHDPFANVTLEALASGVPVISTAANGAVSVLGAGAALEVVDEDCEPQLLAARIEGMLEPVGLDSRRAAARAQAEHFSQERATRSWEQLLSGELERRRNCA